ncbi:hypothetical protein EDD21DRAFT_385420 [Dissophora ornata]|nr:hypothetical protein EDD21DRAFT_385420 [Dissophora ornata]
MKPTHRTSPIALLSMIFFAITFLSISADARIRPHTTHHSHPPPPTAPCPSACNSDYNKCINSPEKCKEQYQTCMNGC